MREQDQGSYWWGYDLSRPQSYTKCIKQLVRIARLTPEYAEWQKESKKNAGDQCPICGVEYIYVRPETHHYPLTLFEVIESKLQDYIHANSIDLITPLQLIKEVMEDHLHDKIQFVVLCKTCHEKYHAQDPETMRAVEQIYQEKIKANDGRKTE